MNKRLVQIMLGTLFFIAGMFLGEGSILQLPVYVLGYLASGYTVILKAFRNILRGRFFEENFLMSLATLGAFAIREYPEAIAVMLFYQVGEYLQDYAVNRSRKSITNLMDIRPDYANLKRGDTLERVHSEQVAIGDLILVKAGERVPLDGVVVEGRSHLDVSALTGESLPLEVEAGSTLLSGSINIGGILVVRVASLYGESTVSRITTNKYVATPHGIFELKFFFNSGLELDDGSQVGSESVKALIKKFISDEDARSPLSDERIGEMLKEHLVGPASMGFEILGSVARL